MRHQTLASKVARSNNGVGESLHIGMPSTTRRPLPIHCVLPSSNEDTDVLQRLHVAIKPMYHKTRMRARCKPLSIIKPAARVQTHGSEVRPFHRQGKEGGVVIGGGGGGVGGGGMLPVGLRPEALHGLV